MHCSACDRRLHPKGLNFMRIETESASYTTCIPCLRIAQKTLRRLRDKSFEEKELLKTLNRVLLVN